MRSLAFTFFLGLATALICALAVMHLKQGNFDTILGKPATPLGQHLYQSFHPSDVKHIRIITSGGQASFSLVNQTWQTIEPWSDRMDPRAAMAIIQFTLGMKVEDLAPEDKVDQKQAGLDEQAVNIRLEDSNHRPLAKYKLGHVSPWKSEIEESQSPINSLFVYPQDKRRKDYIYLCSGDITPLFTSGLKLLRDHHPFYFNPLGLQKINIRSQQGELTLGRERPDSAWRIVKPLSLATDTRTMKTLLEGLCNLQASNVYDRAEVTLPSTESSTQSSQIAITPFGASNETILEILPPNSADASTLQAIVSDRPNAVFDLPQKPTSGNVSLADLPLDVNALRDPTLTHLSIPSLQAITIIPANSPEILLTRHSKQPWMATVVSESFQANEANLFSLLKAVTTTRVAGFESDAATDLAPWGLDQPILRLRFVAQNNQTLELLFGIDIKGNYFVNRLGTPTVMRVDSALIHAIAIRPYEWKDSLLWSLNHVNLTTIVRQDANHPPLTLKYHFIDESWKAEQNGKDLSTSLSPSRANFMLSHLQGIHVSRWLASNDIDALAALSSPTLQISIFEDIVDDDDLKTGILQRKLILAPASVGPFYGSYYGIIQTNQHPFIINAETYQKIAVDLFEN